MLLSQTISEIIPSTSVWIPSIKSNNHVPYQCPSMFLDIILFNCRWPTFVGMHACPPLLPENPLARKCEHLTTASVDTTHPPSRSTAKAQVRALPSCLASTTLCHKTSGGWLDSDCAAPKSSTFSPFKVTLSTATMTQMNECMLFIFFVLVLTSSWQTVSFLEPCWVCPSHVQYTSSLTAVSWSSPTPNYGNTSLGMSRNNPLFCTPT